MIRRNVLATLLPAAVLIAVPVVMAGQGATKAPAAAPAASSAALKNPAALKETAPMKFGAKFETSAGNFTIEVHRDWAPNGADRFYNLVKNGYYDNCRFFRVIAGFMVQFGINGDPALNAVWRGAQIPRDPVKQSNKRGFVSFAMGASPDTRTTQVFISYGDNARLDASGFAAFGEVAAGEMSVVDAINSSYGEGAPSGKGPDQTRVQTEGNPYLLKDFPKLDYVKKATITR